MTTEKKTSRQPERSRAQRKTTGARRAGQTTRAATSRTGQTARAATSRTGQTARAATSRTGQRPTVRAGERRTTRPTTRVAAQPTGVPVTQLMSRLRQLSTRIERETKYLGERQKRMAELHKDLQSMMQQFGKGGPPAKTARPTARPSRAASRRPAEQPQAMEQTTGEQSYSV